MVAKTPAERALAQSYTTGDGSTRFNVDGLAVDPQQDRSVTMTYWLTVKDKGREDERWVFTLPWENSFADVFESPNPDPERLRLLVHMVRAHLEEWWDTKSYNRLSAKMGRKLT